MSVRGNTSGGVVVGTPTLSITGQITFTDDEDPSLDCTGQFSAGPGAPTPLPEPAGPELATSLGLTDDTATHEVTMYAAVPDVPPLLISSGAPGSQCAGAFGVGTGPWPGYVALPYSAVPWSMPYALNYSAGSLSENVVSTLSVSNTP